MTHKLPTGFPVGEMQAPFKWMLIHAARFQGIIHVQAPDGEGYVLVRKGNPMGCTFQRGGEELKGQAAYLHILSVPVVDLSIYRYTSEEMEEASRILRESGAMDTTPGQGTPGVDSALPQEEKGGKPGSVHPAKGDAGPPPAREEPSLRAQERESVAGVPEEPPVILPSGLDVENLAYLLLGRILRFPGVQAVSIFGRGKSVLSIGDVKLDSLVVLAEDMLHAAHEISSVMHTGTFVHLTLQIPAGKVIIAPYFNEYLCILTNPGVNLGQIRKILKEIPDVSGDGRSVS